MAARRKKSNSLAEEEMYYPYTYSSDKEYLRIKCGVSILTEEGTTTLIGKNIPFILQIPESVENTQLCVERLLTMLFSLISTKQSISSYLDNRAKELGVGSFYEAVTP